MDRRDFCRLIVKGAGVGASFPSISFAPGAGELRFWAADSSTARGGEYPNHRDPLLNARFVRLPLGAIRARGWLLDQLIVQKNGLTGHLGEVWETSKVSAWKGNAGKNIMPECCVPRFVPRWLEGLTVLAGVLGDVHLRTITDPYMQFILDVREPATITPSVIAWSHLGRFLPDYYELSGDRRAITQVGKILGYADSVRDSQDKSVMEEPNRLGMLLSFGYWYYDRTGDPDVLALLERCTKHCVDDWKNYFVNFPADSKYFVHFPEQTAEKPNEPLSDWTRQGVDTTQAIQYPMQHYLISGDETDKECILKGIANLDLGYGQVGGRWSGDEWLASTDPTQGTELCDVEELLFSLEKGFEICGEVSFADRIEQLIFNSFPGTCAPDMWAHQYDQQANQVLVSVAKRHWHGNDNSANIYGFAPNLPCCLANMHSPWPRFVQTMWMTTTDRGLVVATYSPCRLKAVVGNGSTVELTEETDYPFSDRVQITVQTERPVSFPIYFRIPSWTEAAEVELPGASGPIHAKGGTFFKVARTWTSGDIVKLAFNFKVRTETRRNNAIAIAWGPLYFVLRIGETFEKIPAQGLTASSKDTPAPPGCVDWQITPTSDWNYALAIDRDHPQCTMITNRIGSMPFAQKGELVKRAGSNEFAPWQEDVPVVLRVKARKVPQWGMVGASAGEVPLSPVHTDTPETLIELIPYGCSRLRIAEFPTV